MTNGLIGMVTFESEALVRFVALYLLVWDSARTSWGMPVRGLRTEGGYTRRQDKGGYSVPGGGKE